MDKRHVDLLRTKFERVCDEGAAWISKAEIMRWWDRKRLTASVWADLMERWEEDNEDPLLIGELSNGDFLLVYGGKAFLAPLAEWAGEPSA